MRRLDLKLVVGLVLISVILTSAIWYVWAATPSSTIWISPGVYPGAPSYTIWTEGSNYFSKTESGQLLTVDNTNASEVIQGTIDLCTGGESIYIKVGTYDEMVAISLISNLTIYGDGWNYGVSGIPNRGTVLKAKTGFSGNFLSCNGSAPFGHHGYIILRDFAISLGGSVSPTTGIYMYFTIRNILDNLCIRQAYTHSIYFNAVEQTRVTNCFFHSFRTYGIYLLWSSSIYISRNEFASSWGTEYGVFLSSSLLNTVHDNTFYFEKHAIYIYNHSNGTIVSENRIWMTTNIAIFAYSAVYHNTIANNMIVDCGSGGALGGIEILDANSTLVFGNQIYDDGSGNMSIGIKETGTSDYNMIIANDCKDVISQGILTVGTYTQVNLCWNKTTWIS